MSTPIAKMQEIGIEYIQSYQSDMIWDGVTIGKYSNNETNQKYLWIIRKTGTHLLFLSERRRLKGMFDFIIGEHKAGTEMRFFFIENPTISEGRIFEISSATAEMVMESEKLEYPEPI